MFRRLRHPPALALLASAILLGFASSADAQPTSGTYQVKYEAVADDCDGEGLTLSAGAARVQSDSGKLTLSLDGVAPMKGRQAADGQFKAQAQGAGAKPDLRGKYSASGKTVRDSLEMVFIAQFYRGKRPLCTQSWTVSGTRGK
jgi:hypothetical protein